MINGISWLVVTKMDVLDHLAEIPVCVGYKINGKLTERFRRRPADTTRSNASMRSAGLEDVRRRMRARLANLPKQAREYLAFIEKETEARVGMVSTGP